MASTPEIYVSIDIEADGPYPGEGTGYSMLAIGAVAVMRREGNDAIRLDMDDKRNQFYRTIRPISQNQVQTAVDVCKQGGVDRSELVISGLSPSSVMSDFVEWVDEITYKGASRAIPVTYPSWDVQWIHYYLERYLPHNPNHDGVRMNPFGHSRYLDLKSYYAGKYGVPFQNAIKSNMPKRLKSKRKHTHNALDDAVEQGELFCNIYFDTYAKGF